MLEVGGKLYYNSFYKLVNDLIEKHKKDKDLAFIPNDSFLTFFDSFIEALFINMPDIIKIMLRLVYNSVVDVFKIEKNNYSPLYTILIFNFFISPKMQDLYDISSVKFVIVRNLNRLIRVNTNNKHQIIVFRIFVLMKFLMKAINQQATIPSSKNVMSH